MALSQEDVQGRVMIFQFLQQHREQLRQQAQILERQSLEAEMTSQALDNLSTLPEDNEVLLPLGSGMYAPGKTAKVKEVLVDVGANVAIKKPVPEAKAIVEARKKELEDTGERMQKDLQETLMMIQQVAGDIQQYQVEQGQQSGEASEGESSEEGEEEGAA